jgi:phosphatidylglycerol lysyltransferase
MSPRRAGVRAVRWVQRNRTALSIIGTVLVVAVAGIALANILSALSWNEVMVALRAISPLQLGLCLLLTTLSYLTLTFYDRLALMAMGKRQPWWRTALGAFSAYCFSHNFGFAPVTGAAARWRAYAGAGLSAADIARIVVLAGVTFWLGIFLMMGLFLVTRPGVLRIEEQVLDWPVQLAIGLVILLFILVYLVACIRRRGPLRILGWQLPVPTFGQAMIQFALAATDITLAAAALLVLLPGNHWAMFPDFVVAYVVAMVVALVTHAPGGLGVFEAVILVTLPEVDRASLVSALIVYRVVYYWLPLLLSIALLGGREALRFRDTPFTIDKAGQPQRKTRPAP